MTKTLRTPKMENGPPHQAFSG